GIGGYCVRKSAKVSAFTCSGSTIEKSRAGSRNGRFDRNGSWVGRCSETAGPSMRLWPSRKKMRAMTSRSASATSAKGTQEQAAMKPSTVMPTTERDRRARSAARAAMAWLVLSALLTAGDGRGIDTACMRDSSSGGGAKVASLSASRDMATSPESGCAAAASWSLMATLRAFHADHSEKPHEHGLFPDSRLNG